LLTEFFIIIFKLESESSCTVVPIISRPVCVC